MIAGGHVGARRQPPEVPQGGVLFFGAAVVGHRHQNREGSCGLSPGQPRTAEFPRLERRALHAILEERDARVLVARRDEHVDVVQIVNVDLVHHESPLRQLLFHPGYQLVERAFAHRLWEGGLALAHQVAQQNGAVRLVELAAVEQLSQCLGCGEYAGADGRQRRDQNQEQEWERTLSHPHGNLQ